MSRLIIEDNNLDDNINNEIKSIKKNYWAFIDDVWKMNENKYKHRTEVKHINEIEFIKQTLFEKLGYIAVFFFLNVLYASVEYPSPYFELEKGLFLLFHLVSGISGKYEIERYLPYSSFHSFYKKFWMYEENYKRINKIVDDALKNMFSNVDLRINCARKFNPELFKHITLLGDGHDSRLNYVNTNIKKEKMYSYKFKKNGIRTQIITDINDMILFVSKSNLCSDASDGTMFLNMRLYRKMDEYDVLGIDGGYTLFVQKIIELCKNKEVNISEDNFVYPIRKEVNSQMTEVDKHFNNVFGSFRSKIENTLGTIGNKFKRFNNNASVVRMDNYHFYNLQLKVACLMYNIQRFTDMFHIDALPHNKLWMDSEFQFPIKTNIMDMAISNENDNRIKFNNMISKQNERNKNINNQNINQEISSDEYNPDDNDLRDIDSNSDNEGKNIKINKKKRKVKAIKNKQVYEMEAILGHKYEDNQYMFLIKWMYYDETHNSYIPYENFTKKDLLNDYLAKNNIEI